MKVHRTLLMRPAAASKMLKRPSSASSQNSAALVARPASKATPLPTSVIAEAVANFRQRKAQQPSSVSTKRLPPLPTLQEKADNRMEKFSGRITPNLGTPSVPSLCESLKQMDHCLEDYLKRLEILEKWRVDEGLPPAQTAPEIIFLMLKFVDACFLSGMAHSDASKTWAAVQARIPQVLEHPALCARMKRAMDGFAKRGPAGSRDPPPEEIVFAVVGCLVWMGEPVAALNELCRFLAGGRPGEMDSLQVNQLIPPGKSSKFWSILWHPTEGQQPGKTGEFDESVVLDQPLMAGLETSFHSLVAGRPGDEQLWPIKQAQLQTLFDKAVMTLGLQHMNLVRYSWRHAAASADLLHSRRTHEEVKARYRWQSDSSMRRYAKAARANFYAQQVNPKIMDYGSSVKTLLPSMFAGQVLKPPTL